MSTEDSAEGKTSACDGKHSTETTTIYLAGEGRAWKDELRNDESFAKANVEFVTDRSLLDDTDGTFLKYTYESEHYDGLNDESPIAVWWDEYGHATSTVEGGYFSLEDAPSWVYDTACTIGVYEDRTTALTSLLSSTGHGADSGQESPATHGFLPAVRKEPDAQQGFCSDNPYPCEVDDGTTTDTTAMLHKDKPFVPTLAMFATYGVGAAIPRAWFNEDIANHDKASISAVLSFLDTLGVLDYNTDDEVLMTDDSRLHELLAEFVPWYHGSPTPT